MELSIIIPVFNSEKSLEQLTDEIMQELVDRMGTAFEIILIDDCSSDNSWKIIQTLSGSRTQIKGVRLSRNYGQHNSILCGINHAQGELIITMDDDLQHPPKEIHTMLAALDDEHDVVYGTPIKQKHSLARTLSSRLTKWVLQRAMGSEVAGQASAFRLFRRSFCESFANYQSSNINIDIMLTWVTNRFKAVKVEHLPRQHGETGYTFTKLLQHAMNMVTGFSTLPLQIASYLGLIFALFGVGVLLYILVIYMIYGSVVPGFAFLASVISIFSGAQLLTIGIIGEYLARIHVRSMNRPSYIVREHS
ncbi:MAG: glycosyltransferase family 2 protein [Pseudomonadota bacterium]